MTHPVWILSNGLRVLRLKSPQELDLLAGENLDFDAVEMTSAMEDYQGLVPYAGRIKALWHCSAASTAGLEKLQAIESINSSHGGEQRFDYRLLKNLKEFVCADGSTIAAKYLNHPRLELINLGECKVESFKVLSDATRLRQLRLSACKVKSLDGIEAMSALRELRLPEARTLVDIGSISSCEGLEVLEITNARKLLDVSPIQSLHKLKLLFISAPAAAFAQVQWLSEMPELRCAGIYVPIARIDWDVFARHPRLYDFSIHSVPGGLTETDEEIASRLAAAGRKVLKLTRFKVGPAIRVELEPVKGTLDPLPSTHYQNVLGKVPPN